MSILDDVDRKMFWEKLKDVNVVVHKLSLKHPSTALIKQKKRLVFQT